MRPAFTGMKAFDGLKAMYSLNRKASFTNLNSLPEIFPCIPTGDNGSVISQTCVLLLTLETTNSALLFLTLFQSRKDNCPLAGKPMLRLGYISKKFNHPWELKPPGT